VGQLEPEVECQLGLCLLGFVMGGRVVTPAIQCSVGCGLWLLWHLGPDIILDWME